MNKIAIAKAATSWIVGAGVGSIVHNIIKNNTQPDEEIIDGELVIHPNSRLSRVSIPAASVVVSMMAKDACSSYTDAQIDKLVAFYDKITNKTESEPASE